MIEKDEKITAEILRTDLSYHPSVTEYAETYAQSRILFSVILICLVVIIVLGMGF